MTECSKIDGGSDFNCPILHRRNIAYNTPDRLSIGGSRKERGKSENKENDKKK